MAPDQTAEPPLERWWDRRIDSRVAVAVGLAPEADEDAIARHFRSMVGRSPGDSTDPRLWARYLYSIELARTGWHGARGDQAEFANNVVGWAVVLPGDSDAERYGEAAWARELGVTPAECDPILRELAYDEIAPRLERAGLYAIL
jgi:hypothetical protein